MMTNESNRLSKLKMGLITCLIGGLLLFCIAAPSVVAYGQPRLAEGYNSLFERVLTRPDASILSAPEGAADSVVNPPPFTVLYVFDRAETGGEAWAEVGPAIAGDPIGWVPNDQVVEWNHQMVLSFANPVGRLPVLLFEDRPSTVAFFEDEALPVIGPETVEAARNEALPADSPVISIEPEGYINIESNLYLLPILSAEQVFLASGTRGRLVEIASLPIDEDPITPPPEEEALEDLRAGVVFVVDTTRSMDPYIERTREAIADVFDQIRGSEIGDRVSFGMIGFRDSTEGVDELEYVSRTYAPLQWPPDHDGFRDAIEEVEAAVVSSRGYNEDGLAGIDAAINMAEWRDFDARLIIFVSDAGLRAPDDPRSATGLRPEEMNGIAIENGIAISVLHLLTPIGEAYHPAATDQYLALAAFDSRAPLYFPVANGDVHQFGVQVDRLVEALTGLIGDSLAGRLVEIDPDADPEDIEGAIAFVARAMQLAYLARVSGTDVPDVFRAWTFDHAMGDPTRKALDVRVLLTRNQLSNLSEILNRLLETARADDSIGSTDFFDMLRGAIGGMMIDGDVTVSNDFETLGQALGDYLDVLPYSSEVLGISADRWTESAAFRDDVLDGVESKLRAYRMIFSNVDLWTPLYEGAPEGEHVYPMPIDLMP